MRGHHRSLFHEKITDIIKQGGSDITELVVIGKPQHARHDRRQDSDIDGVFICEVGTASYGLREVDLMILRSVFPQDRLRQPCEVFRLLILPQRLHDFSDLKHGNGLKLLELLILLRHGRYGFRRFENI